VVVRWTEYGEAQATDEFVLDPLEAPARADGLWLEVVVFAHGQAGARLISRPAP